jgi:hypothetical protein
MRIQTFIAAGGGRGGEVKDLYSEVINLRVTEDIDGSSARSQGGGDKGPVFFLIYFCGTFRNAVSI